jgi:hydrogenase maturation protease
VIVGLGRDGAGDDAIGLHVARALADRYAVRELSDASALVPLLETVRVVIVDAVVGLPPGTVARLDPDALAGYPPVSSHGMAVATALALARTLYGAIDVAVVGIGIARPADGPLSPEIAAAIAPAAALAASLADA